MEVSVLGDRLLIRRISCAEATERGQDGINWLMHVAFAERNVAEDTLSVHGAFYSEVCSKLGLQFPYPWPHLDESASVNYGITTPYPHQRITLRKALRFNRFGILSDMGTGKAKSCIDFALNKKPNRIIIVCPASLIGNWYQEIKRHSGVDAIPVEERLTSQRRRTVQSVLTSKQNWVIINYESLPIMYDLMSKACTGDNLIILDEVTRTKNPKAKRTEAAIRLAWKCKYAVVASGNIRPESELDIYCPWFILDHGDAFGRVSSADQYVKGFFKFRNRFFVAGYMNWSFEPRPFAKEYIQKVLAFRGIRFNRSQCVDIPPVQEINIPLRLEGKLEKSYDELTKQAILEIQGEAGTNVVKVGNALAMTEKLRQVISGFVYTYTTDTAGKRTKVLNVIEDPVAKLAALVDILDGSKDCAIVWCEYDHDADLIMKKLAEHNIAAVSLLAGSSVTEVEAAKAAIGKTHRVLVTKPSILGYGHTINQARIMIYYSMGYSGEDYTQSRCRNQRIGQHDSVVVVHLTYNRTVDVAIKKAVQGKMNQSKALLTPDDVVNEVLKASE